MTHKNLIEGLTILAKYTLEGLGSGLCAEHDQIYLVSPGEAKDISEEDLATLKDLHFYYSESDGWYCFT